MPWFKVDDGFYDHPKVDELPLDAVGLWLLAGTYAARQLTDGHVPARRVHKLGGTDETAATLVAAGLWVQVSDGYVFRDWHDYQPSRDDILAKRDAERERKAAQRSRKRVPGGVPAGVPVGQRAESQRVSHAESQRVSQGVSAHPDPTRPDPTNEEHLLTADASSVSDSSESFDEFWAAYPRKVGKAAAKKSWARAIKRAPASVVIAGCQSMAADPNLPTDKNFIPHPATWLNRDGWEDEPYPQPEAKPADRPTPTPPIFDASKLRPDNPIPMPDNVRQLLKGETA